MTDSRLRRLLTEGIPCCVGSSAEEERARRQRAPSSACTPAALRFEVRTNVSAAAECAFLVAKRWAWEEVRPWHERYGRLACAAGARRSRLTSREPRGGPSAEE